MNAHLVCKTLHAARFCWLHKIPLIPKLLWCVNRVIFACDISYKANIDRTVDFFHNGLGVVISPKVLIGSNCKIYQNVTIGGGGSTNAQGGHPVIGNDVIIYSGAVIIGGITIGDGCVIGANAVVRSDIPPHSIAVGVPARYHLRNE